MLLYHILCCGQSHINSNIFYLPLLKDFLWRIFQTQQNGLYLKRESELGAVGRMQIGVLSNWRGKCTHGKINTPEESCGAMYFGRIYPVFKVRRCVRPAKNARFYPNAAQSGVIYFSTDVFSFRQYIYIYILLWSVFTWIRSINKQLRSYVFFIMSLRKGGLFWVTFRLRTSFFWSVSFKSVHEKIYFPPPWTHLQYGHCNHKQNKYQIIQIS